MLGWVTKEYNSNIQYAYLIMDCKTLINQISQLKISYYFCEANKCTDAMARRGGGFDQDFMLFDSPSVDLCMLLYYDNSGLYYEFKGYILLILMSLFRFSL